MKHIGLLMCGAADEDVLGETIEQNERLVDCFYALTAGASIKHEKCVWQARDSDVPASYPDRATDGYRQFLYEQAVLDHGHGNWFLLLHADEIWRVDPPTVVAEHPGADGFVFRVPFWFPVEPWDNTRGISQLTHRLGPGWPEFRMFRGSPDVGYQPGQHFNTAPSGLRNIVHTDHVIDHYPYRSAEQQAAKRAHHFDPDNYQQEPVWTEETIRRALESEHYTHVDHRPR